MQECKYYDYKNDRPINLDSDGCDLAEWNSTYEKSSFAWHPKGFKIFLLSHQLSHDEYMDSDPYSMEENLKSDFHCRRIKLTVDLLHKAVYSIQSPKILDLGCGQGHITQAMWLTLKNSDFTGLDYSVRAIEYANDHFPDIDFSVGNAYDAPYSRNYFDVVVCNNLWEHVPDPVNLLGKIKAILKPGGSIIMSTPSRYRIGNLIRIMGGKPVFLMSSHHVTEYTVGQVLEQFSWEGFQVETILSSQASVGSLSRIVRKVVEMWVSFIGSHHQVQSSVFYLAKKPYE